MRLNSYNLIAVSGLKNSGKNIATEMIQYCLSCPRWLRSYTGFKLFKNIFKKFNVVSFADPLKRTLAALLDIPVERFEDREFKEHTYINFKATIYTNSYQAIKHNVISDNQFSRAIANKDFSFLKESWISMRQLLQCFGTEIMRDIFGDKIWINLTLKQFYPMLISDLRFKTEFNAVKEKNGAIIYIKRDSCTPGTHASEREVLDLYQQNKFNYVIENNGSLKDLFNNIRNIC